MFQKADINNDDLVNILDIVTVVKLILAGTEDTSTINNIVNIIISN